MFTITLLWWLFAPGYTAQALLAVGPVPATILRGGEPIYSKEIIERYKRSWATLVKDDPVLVEAAKDSRVTKTAWYQENRNEIIEAMFEDISSSAVPETEFIRIAMTGRNKAELPDIVNAIAEAFVKYAGRDIRATRDDQMTRLNIEAGTLRSALNTLRNEVSQVLAGSDAAGLNANRNEAAIKLEMLLRDYNLAKNEYLEAQMAWLSWQRILEEKTYVKDPRVVMGLDMDGQLRALRAQELDLTTRLENMVTRLGRDHRSVVSVRGLIQALRDQIDDRTGEVTAKAVESITQQFSMSWELVKKKVADLTDEMEANKATRRDLEKKLRLVDGYVRDIANKDDDLRTIERRLLELRTGMGDEEGSQQRQVGPVTLRSAAALPRRPSKPQWSLMLPAGILLGLVLGFGLAFLLEFADTSVKSPSDIARRVDLPMLGMVPHADDLDEEIPDFRRATVIAPHSLAAEAFRQIRTNLLFSGPAEQRRSLLITSPAPEDGRTTVVMNLAASMAQAGRRVLVVDANFRQPAIGKMFPEATEAGLSSALVGQANWKDVVSPSGVPNFDVITSGPLPPNPADLLGSDKMRDIIAEMAGEYDQVIFDGSPVMVVTDACVLSTLVDAVILVVRAGRNSTGIVQKAASQLQRVGAHVVGTVLQGVRTTAGGYLRKNYETFYEYHQQALP
jgi:capsular exopolysaccharide synthesis family protein